MKNTTDNKHFKAQSEAAKNLNLARQISGNHKRKRNRQWCTRNIRAITGVHCPFSTMAIGDQAL